MDLVKPYDRVNWSFLRLLLIDLDIKVTNWIMGCLSFANFFVLINGTPSKFFTCFKGLRHGCPLSPLLFLLIIESLSWMINLTKRDGLIMGSRSPNPFDLTHLLLVDDVLIFGEGSVS